MLDKFGIKMGKSTHTKKCVFERKFSMFSILDTNLWHQGHVSRVRALDCQSDKVLSGSDDRSVKLWSIETGNKNQGQKKIQLLLLFLCIFVGNPNKIWIYDWAFELGRLNISFSLIIAELTKVGHNYRK